MSGGLLSFTQNLVRLHEDVVFCVGSHPNSMYKQLPTREAGGHVEHTWVL